MKCDGTLDANDIDANDIDANDIDANPTLALRGASRAAESFSWYGRLMITQVPEDNV